MLEYYLTRRHSLITPTLSILSRETVFRKKKDEEEVKKKCNNNGKKITICVKRRSIKGLAELSLMLNRLQQEIPLFYPI